MSLRYLRFLPLFAVLTALPCQSALAAPNEVKAVEVKGSEFKPHAKDMGFQPHKALYDIELASVRSGSQILNISGQMYYEWQESCEAWVTNHRFNLLYEYTDSAPMRITSNFSTYEPFDGQSLNFTSVRRRDGDIFEEIRGNAKIEKTGLGLATYTFPTELEYELPAGALFPIAHTYEIAKKIRAGETFYNAVIFDGSDEDGPINVNAFIGKPAEINTKDFEDPGIDQSLIKPAAHNVRLAFFPVNQDEAASDYEMNLVFHDNSVISDMVVEYDDFSVKQHLIAIEPMQDGCKAPETQE